MPKIPKKILFVINTMNVGGAAKMLNFVANLSVDLFESVTLISMFEKNVLFLDDQRVKNINLDIEIKGKFWRIGAARALRMAIKAENPDIVCAFISDVAFNTRIATLGMKCIFVSAERGDPYSLPHVWRFLTKFAYSNSDYCFFQLDRARDFFGKKVAKKSYVIPNSYTAKENIEPYTGERRKTIVSVGRFERQKGYDILIDAFVKVHERFPDYRLVLYGAGGAEEDYKRQVEELGLSDFVDFPGYINDAAERIREDGVFVLPSRFEGIPNSLIEALSVGIPTVSCDCTPGGPEFLTDGGRRGLLVPTENSELLADAIIRIICDPKLATELSRLGPTVKAELTPERITEMWRTAFLEIAERNKK